MTDVAVDRKHVNVLQPTKNTSSMDARSADVSISVILSIWIDNTRKFPFEDTITTLSDCRPYSLHEAIAVIVCRSESAGEASE